MGLFGVEADHFYVHVQIVLVYAMVDYVSVVSAIAVEERYDHTTGEYW